MLDNIAVLLCLLFFAGYLAQWLAWWVKLPAILFLLSIGILAGPVLGLLKPDEVFGDLLFPMISLSVAVILFEGSLTLKMHEFKQIGTLVRRLVTVGVLVTWVIVTLGCHYLLDISWAISILFGALMTVTGPTVVVPMLRSVRPNQKVSNTLRWEGILIDPIGALFAVVVYEFLVIQIRQEALSSSLLLFGEILLLGSVLGIGMGYLLGLLLRHHLIPEFLQNMATLAFVLLTFAISNHFAHESGLLAVTLMGMCLANMKDVRTEEVLNFKENLTVMLISVLFIVLAARIELQSIMDIAWVALGAFVIIQFVARPISILINGLGTGLNWREQALVAWIAPRGIVAAAISASFAIGLESAGLEGSNILVPLTFSIIIGTVVLQSFTAGTLARWLKVADPEPNGFLIIGASHVAIVVAEALRDAGCRVRLTDSNYSNIKEARMRGLQTFYGSPVSYLAERELDLVGIGRMLAMSPQKEINSLACIRFQREFEPKNIYSLRNVTDERHERRHQAHDKLRGMTLFGEKQTYKKLSSLIKQGAEVRQTQITDEYQYEKFRQDNPRAIVLFVVSKDDPIKVVTSQQLTDIDNGDTLIYLNMTSVADVGEVA